MNAQPISLFSTTLLTRGVTIQRTLHPSTPENLEEASESPANLTYRQFTFGHGSHQCMDGCPADNNDLIYYYHCVKGCYPVCLISSLQNLLLILGVISVWTEVQLMTLTQYIVIIM